MHYIFGVKGDATLCAQKCDQLPDCDAFSLVGSTCQFFKPSTAPVLGSPTNICYTQSASSDRSARYLLENDNEFNYAPTSN